jgi:hypothetical protein
MQTFNIAVYIFAVLTCFACTGLLFRMYLKTGYRLLLWSTLCFVGLLVNNVLLLFDLWIWVDVPGLDLRPWRLVSALVGLAFLLYGFIFESE